MAKNANLNQFRQLLSRCKVEDDVRAAYSKFFDIPFDASEYIDLYTPQVLFEFKYDKNLSRNHEKARVLAQALYYVRRLRYGDIDELKAKEENTLFSQDQMQELMQGLRPVPPTICLADVNEAVLTQTELWLFFIEDKQNKYDWTLSPSNPDEQLLKDLAATPDLQALHTFDFNNEQELKIFSDTLSKALELKLSIKGLHVKKQITEKNFERVYTYWERIFGDAVRNGYKPSRYFVSDIQEGNTIFSPVDGKALFNVDNKFIPKKILANDYNWFWSLFDKVKNIDTIRGILAKVDRLTDDSLRRFHGEFFTPIPFATKALDYIADTVGQEWWTTGEYRLWDMAAGTGNLEYNLPAAAWKYCYLSTLEETDVEHLTRLFPDANVFQYNYLDDDIDYIAAKVKMEKDKLASKDVFASYQKLPQKLVDDLNNPNIKWIILINPPFATAQSSNRSGGGKEGVSSTRIRQLMHKDDLGEVSRELFAQFMYRVKYEFAGKQAHLALFSKIIYLNATNDQKLREKCFQCEYERGFIFASGNFSGTSRVTQFPVGMLIWNLAITKHLAEQTIIIDILNNKTEKIDTKHIPSIDKELFLSKWIERPAAIHFFPPFGNAIEVKSANKDRRDRIADGFIGSLMCKGNDLQNSMYTAIFSGPYVSAGALSITSDNFEQAMIVHTARRMPPCTWININDQLLKPSKSITEEFVGDCLLWNIFSDGNQTAALKDVLYEGTTYQIHNHFFPFSTNELKKWQITDSDIRQTLLSAEDTFVCKWLASHTLSPEAQTLLSKGKEIYRFYFENLNQLRTNKFKIETWDAGWYQIRMALKNADLAADKMSELKALHRSLRDKLLPQLYEYGILQ